MDSWLGPMKALSLQGLCLSILPIHQVFCPEVAQPLSSLRSSHQRTLAMCEETQPNTQPEEYQADLYAC